MDDNLLIDLSYNPFQKQKETRLDCKFHRLFLSLSLNIC